MLRFLIDAANAQPKVALLSELRVGPEKKCERRARILVFDGAAATVILTSTAVQEIKRDIFTTIRCLHCTQHCPRGGDKKECTLQLKGYQIQWLAAVAERCGHPSVQKTVRILCDYFFSIAGSCRTQAGKEFCERHAKCVQEGEAAVFGTGGD